MNVTTDDGLPEWGTDRCEHCGMYIVYSADRDGWELWSEPGVTHCTDGDRPGGRHRPEPMSGADLVADHMGQIELAEAS